MNAEESRRSRFRELSYLLDDDDNAPISLEIHNLPEVWCVHAYVSKDEQPVVKSGADLSAIIEDAVETYRRRRVVNGMAAPAKEKKR
jgi:hypothetical protein